jgi:peptidyl-prolyl cis-trans isomerase D
MSVIQKIRDKYAVVIIVLICVAIVSFLLQDVFFGRNSMFSQSNAVGKVNGTELSLADYQQRIENAQRMAQQNMGGLTLSDEQNQQIREEAWNGFLQEQIMKGQFEELGIEVTEAELIDAVNSKNPHPIMMRYFVNPETGQFDRSLIDRVRENARQDQTGQMAAQLQMLDREIEQYQANNKYITLINQAINYPKWMADMQQADNAKNANIGYVHVPYVTIADSTVKVTDAELNKYIQDHKAAFQVPESRRIEYVTFDVVPSASDSAAALADLEKLRVELDTTPDPANFVKLNSELGFNDVFISRNAIQVPEKDSIVDLPVGAMYGPYRDANSIVYAKMLARRTQADTVKFSHILLVPQSPAADTIAKKQADSLAGVIRAGGDIAALAAQFSQDPYSNKTGGEYTLSGFGQLPNEFAPVKEAAYLGTTGEVKVIKLPIGYSVMKITAQINPGPAVKVAYLAKRVDASSTTSTEALSAANEFAGKNRDKKSFDKTIQEKGLNKRLANNLRPMDFVIQGLGNAREVIAWAYEADPGDVSPVFSLEDRFVIAVLAGARAEGTAALEDVRPQVEAEVRKIKKAEQIMAKMKEPATLEAAAAATNQPVLTAEGVSFGSPFVAALGPEPRIAGAAFNKAWGTAKASAPIQGTSGVYVIKVNNYVDVQQPAYDYKTQRDAVERDTRQMVDQLLFPLILKKKSEVKDDRAKFFRAN